MLRRATFWLRVGVGVAAGAGLGVAALALAPSVYESSTSVLVEAVGNGAAEPNMLTEAELVSSTRISADAYARITGDPVQPLATGRLVAVRAVPGAWVLEIVFQAPTAEGARAGATAFAEAYLADRADTARTAVNAEISSVQRQLDEVRTELGEVNAMIAQTPSRSPEIDSLRATQTSLSAQAATLTVRLGELQTVTVDPGRIVTAAALPGAPVRPHQAAYLGTATLAGVLAGTLTDLMLTRWSRRVRGGHDLRRHRIPVLAELEPAALATGGGHQDPNGRAFSRLRNEVIAALGPSDHTLLVTGASPGSASTLVAASLAAAFARTDNDVVVVGARVPELSAVTDSDSAEKAVTLATIFDLADIPGLTDVLTARTTLARAVQRAARAPRLQVVTPGGTASASGLLQAEGARSVLRLLATRTRYVIVDAPSTASGADAQSLASAVDVALLVVEANHTQHAQVSDAVTQLARVGTRLLGAIVVPGRDVLGPYGLRSMSTADSGRTRDRVPAVVSGFESPGWIGGRTASLDGPTTKLDFVNGRQRTPPDEELSSRTDTAEPAEPPLA